VTALRVTTNRCQCQSYDMKGSRVFKSRSFNLSGSRQIYVDPDGRPSVQVSFVANGLHSTPRVGSIPIRTPQLGLKSADQSQINASSFAVSTSA
jgi:hypothetical protein